MKNNIDNLESKKYLTMKDIEDFPELLDIGKLLNINNPRQLIYHKKNSLDQIPVCQCGTQLKWNNDKRSYRDFCSKKCSALYSIEKRKQTSLKRYGVDHFSKTEDPQVSLRQKDEQQRLSSHMGLRE